MKKRLPLRLGIALGLLSASVIASQLAIMQILAFIQWHHFAFMVISIAMLGFGAAGTVISLFKRRLLQHADNLIPLMAVFSGLTLELAMRFTNTDKLSFDLYHLFIDASQFWVLAANFVLYFLPFFLAAMVIGLFFTNWVSQIGLLYFSNLLGSGIGGLIGLFFLSLMFPWDALSFCSLFAMISGLLMIRQVKQLYAFKLTLLVILTFSLKWIWPLSIHPSQYKSLSKSMNLPEAEIIFEQPGIYGLNQVLISPALRYAPGLGLTYDGDIPVKPAVFTNGDFSGVLTTNWNRNPHPTDFTTFALPYKLAKVDSVLILNESTGYFAAHALRQGSQFVDVSEPDRKLVNLIQTLLADISDSIYNHPNINVHTLGARAFLASSPHKYDLIVIPVMDAFGGTSGLYAMQENYLLTVEGFGQMWQSLKPQGMISISCWLDYPVRTPLKITTTFIEMLGQQNVTDPENHIAMIKSWGTATFIVSKQALNEQQINMTRDFCGSLQFDPVLLPGIYEDERNRHHVFGDISFFNMLDEIISGSRKYDEYAFNINPATDNRPYFNQFFRLKSFSMLSGLYNQQALPFLELGYLIVLVTLLQVIVLALLFIIMPLFGLKTGAGRKFPTLIYFAALGLGYMFIEIMLIQRFILYFGTPVIATALVISILLIASGAGSFVSGHLKPDRKTMFIIFAFILFVGVLMLAGINPLLRASSGNAYILKIAIAIVIIAVPGFFMGMPFPLGLRSLSLHHDSMVPWAWGINGCLSVIASPLAILVAVEAGFNWVMVVAVCVYLLALLFSDKIFQKGKRLSDFVP